jgi:hypothetical protein
MQTTAPRPCRRTQPPSRRQQPSRRQRTRMSAMEPEKGSPFKASLPQTGSFKAAASFRLSRGASLAAPQEPAADAAHPGTAAAAAQPARASAEGGGAEEELVLTRENELQELRQKLSQATEDLKRNVKVWAAAAMPACLPGGLLGACCRRDVAWRPAGGCWGAAGGLLPAAWRLAAQAASPSQLDMRGCALLAATCWGPTPCLLPAQLAQPPGGLTTRCLPARRSCKGVTRRWSGCAARWTS